MSALLIDVGWVLLLCFAWYGFWMASLQLVCWLLVRDARRKAAAAAREPADWTTAEDLDLADAVAEATATGQLLLDTERMAGRRHLRPTERKRA